MGGMDHRAAPEKEGREERYRQILKKSGVRPTARRILILKAISEGRRPLSASEIMTLQESRGLRMDRATLYRTLNLFLEKGLVQRFSSADSSFRFGIGTRIEDEGGRRLHDHPHFFCTACGRMSCLAADAVNIELPQEASSMPGRAVKIEIRIDGICHECQKRGDEEEG